MIFSPLIGVSLFVRVFLFSPFLVQGSSMLPTLHDGDVFLLDKISYEFQEPQRDDVVVFALPDEPEFFYVKRVIGLPGDHIHLKADGVYLVDDVGEGDAAAGGVEKKLDEPFVLPESVQPEKFLSTANELGENFVVPAGKYFVLGDNRQHSKDSRYFKDPFIPREQIVGRYALPLFSAAFFDFTSGSVSLSSLKTGTVEVQLPAGGSKKFTVEVADTASEHEIGLMYRAQLPQDHGMFFRFDSPQILTFWMKNTLIPLDIIFIDKNLKVMSIASSVPPCKVDPCQTYSSGAFGQYVLELNAGVSAKLGIKEGAVISLQLPNATSQIPPPQRGPAKAVAN